MSGIYRWRVFVAGSAAALALLACGGGSSGNGNGSGSASSAAPAAATDAGAPAMTNNIAVDGRNWINYRRTQAGLPVVTENAQINIAALGHSEYQRTNNTVTHEEAAGKPGFTGATLQDRLNAAGWTVPANGFAISEVISATTNTSGFYMAEELITAIYHRFAIFEPRFKEIGSGAATTSAGYTYFTADFGARGGWGQGIAAGTVATWPSNGQVQVPPNFFSDFETPDPVPNGNEVGYPISVHANLESGTALAVQSFSVRPHGGADLNVQLLRPAGDAETPGSAAAIIPLSPLRAATTYDVTFVGAVNGTPVAKTWSFTTR
ncbi:MAG: CAP domain-containing protein [Massilia sp.]